MKTGRREGREADETETWKRGSKAGRAQAGGEGEKEGEVVAWSYK